MLKNTIFPLLFISLCLAVVGCSDPKPAGFPKLYQVSMIFMQENEPCADVTIMLFPLDDNKWPSGGKTNANGIATFITHGKFSGVPAGKYRIEVSKHETEYVVNGNAKTFTLIEPNLAPIEIEVVAGTNKFEPFDLGKKVRVQIKP